MTTTDSCQVYEEFMKLREGKKYRTNKQLFTHFNIVLSENQTL